MEVLEPFLNALRPLLRAQGARAAYVVGSWARGEADAWSDVDVVIVAPSPRPAVERFKDYLPAILASPRPVEWKWPGDALGEGREEAPAGPAMTGSDTLPW